MDRDKMSILYKGPSIDASYQVSVHLAEGFQRRRLKGENLTDDGPQTTDAKWWQKLTLPLASKAKKETNVYVIVVYITMVTWSIINSFFFIICDYKIEIFTINVEWNLSKPNSEYNKLLYKPNFK